MTIGEIAVEYLCGEPCDDAISRQAVLKLFATHDGKYLFEAIRDLPSVKPQYADDEIKKMQDLEQAEIQKAYELGKAETGHWIETAEDYYKAINEYGGGVNEDTPYFTDDCACSVCLAKFSVIDNETERFDYCPNCGAKMESEEQA